MAQSPADALQRMAALQSLLNEAQRLEAMRDQLTSLLEMQSPGARANGAPQAATPSPATPAAVRSSPQRQVSASVSSAADAPSNSVREAKELEAQYRRLLAEQQAKQQQLAALLEEKQRQLQMMEALRDLAVQEQQQADEEKKARQQQQPAPRTPVASTPAPAASAAVSSSPSPYDALPVEALQSRLASALDQASALQVEAERLSRLRDSLQAQLRGMDDAAQSSVAADQQQQQDQEQAGVPAAQNHHQHQVERREATDASSSDDNSDAMSALLARDPALAAAVGRLVRARLARVSDFMGRRSVGEVALAVLLQPGSEGGSASSGEEGPTLLYLPDGSLDVTSDGGMTSLFRLAIGSALVAARKALNAGDADAAAASARIPLTRLLASQPFSDAFRGALMRFLFADVPVAGLIYPELRMTSSSGGAGGGDDGSTTDDDDDQQQEQQTPSSAAAPSRGIRLEVAGHGSGEDDEDEAAVAVSGSAADVENVARAIITARRTIHRAASLTAMNQPGVDGGAESGDVTARTVGGDDFEYEGGQLGTSYRVDVSGGDDGADVSPRPRLTGMPPTAFHTNISSAVAQPASSSSSSSSSVGAAAAADDVERWMSVSDAISKARAKLAAATSASSGAGAGTGTGAMRLRSIGRDAGGSRPTTSAAGELDSLLGRIRTLVSEDVAASSAGSSSCSTLQALASVVGALAAVPAATRALPAFSRHGISSLVGAAALIIKEWAPAAGQ